jgi:signal transduction histidine kinase
MRTDMTAAAPGPRRQRNTRGPLPFPIGVAFAIALLAIILDAVLVHRLVLETSQLAEGARRTRVATARLLAVQHLLTDAETGQRGYILTGRDEYLAPYSTAIDRLQTALADLKQSFDLTERDRADYRTLEGLARVKQDELTRSIAVYKASGPQAALGIVMDDTGKNTMQAVRTLIQERADELEPDVEARRVAVFRSMERAASFTTATGIVSAIVLVAFGTLLLRHLSLARAKETRLEETAEARASQLAELSRHLLTVREEERARIAHELHDELGSSLTLLSQDIARLRKAIQEGKPVPMSLVEGMQEVVHTSVQQQRHLVHSLRPTALDSLGLRAAIEALAQEFSKHSGIPCRCAMDASVDKVDEERAISLYRIVQESLTNVARHAGATSAEIIARVADNILTVSVSDDGRGVADPSQRPRRSLGMMGMRERARHLGGTLSIGSRRDGKGTIVELRIPAHGGNGLAAG